MQLTAVAKGKQERFFRTVRSQLLPNLSDADTASLQALNRRLWAWVETEYHHHPHRGLDGDTPLDRWAAGRAPRLPEPDLDLDALFLFEAKRRVQRDHTVSLNGTAFEVDAALVGQTVTQRLRPQHPRWARHRGLARGPSGRVRQAGGRLRQLLRAPAPPHPDHRAHRSAHPGCCGCASARQHPGAAPLARQARQPRHNPDINPDINPND